MNQPDFFAALLAGILSFLSPCVIPLVPAYLSFISGTTARELSENGRRGKIFLRSLLFSAGFTVAFTAMGIMFSGGAMFVGQAGVSEYLEIAGGIIIVALGLNVLFDFVRLLNVDTRLTGRLSGGKTTGLSGAFLLGLAFAAGWSPCIGPILASILIFAGREGNIGRAAVLLAAYSIGFAVPFLASGLFFDRLKPALRFFSRHGRAVRAISGIVLIALGAAMAAGGLGNITELAARAGYALEEFYANRPGLAHALAALVFAGAAGAILLEPIRKKSKISRGRAVTAAVAGLAAAMEILGAFSTVSLLAGWLTYTGI